MTARMPRVQFYRAKDGWRWRFISSNGKTLADSGQAYVRKRNAINGLELVTGGEVWMFTDGNTGDLYDPSTGETAAHVEVLP